MSTEDFVPVFRVCFGVQVVAGANGFAVSHREQVARLGYSISYVRNDRDVWMKVLSRRIEGSSKIRG
jgi:anthranilate/para-aminobenzoate synthase component II